MTQEYQFDQEPDETLRRVAELPPPAGLEDRVHRRMERELAAGSERGFWSLWQPSHRLQFAGAAVLMLAIAGSMWSVRHIKHESPAMVQPAAQGQAFGSAGAVRHPASLTPIEVPPTVKKKKPSASKTAKKHTKPSAAVKEPATP